MDIVGARPVLRRQQIYPVTHHPPTKNPHQFNQSQVARSFLIFYESPCRM